MTYYSLKYYEDLKYKNWLLKNINMLNYLIDNFEDYKGQYSLSELKSQLASYQVDYDMFFD